MATLLLTFSDSFIADMIFSALDILFLKFHFYLIRFVLLPSMWSVLEKVTRGAEKKVYIFKFGWNFL